MVSTVAGVGTAARVKGAIASAAAATGVDFNYLFAQARIESGLNPAARARTSTATGLYQFIEQSWLATVDKHGADHGLGWAANAIKRGADGRYRVADPAMRDAVLGLRMNPEAAAAMGAEFASDNRVYLERRLGHAVEPVDLYLAHFLGPSGAGRFLENAARDDSASAASLFPAAAKANRAVFYDRAGNARSLADVRQRFAAKLGNTAPPVTRATDVRFAAHSPPPSPPSQSVASARMAYLMLAAMGVSA